MAGFLFLVGIITGACALVVIADWWGADPSPRSLFGEEPDWMGPWRDREPGDLGSDR